MHGFCVIEFKGTVTPKLALMIEIQKDDKLLGEKCRADQRLDLSSSLLRAQGYHLLLCV